MTLVLPMSRTCSLPEDQRADVTDYSPTWEQPYRSCSLLGSPCAERAESAYRGFSSFLATSKVAYFKRKHVENEDYHPPCRSYRQNACSASEDRTQILQLSLEKLRLIDDPELFLRRSVLINNLLKRVHVAMRSDWCTPSCCLQADGESPGVAAQWLAQHYLPYIKRPRLTRPADACFEYPCAGVPLYPEYIATYPGNTFGAYSDATGAFYHSGYNSTGAWLKAYPEEVQDVESNESGHATAERRAIEDCYAGSTSPATSSLLGIPLGLLGPHAAMGRFRRCISDTETNGDAFRAEKLVCTSRDSCETQSVASVSPLTSNPTLSVDPAMLDCRSCQETSDKEADSSPCCLSARHCDPPAGTKKPQAELG
uniref:SERTA domain-containing protein 4-like n=1 Tax=Myxine glutinosa TaxID=7769 RepID=UPI00358F14F2